MQLNHVPTETNKLLAATIYHPKRKAQSVCYLESTAGIHRHVNTHKHTHKHTRKKGVLLRWLPKPQAHMRASIKTPKVKTRRKADA